MKSKEVNLNEVLDATKSNLLPAYQKDFIEDTDFLSRWIEHADEY